MRMSRERLECERFPCVVKYVPRIKSIQALSYNLTFFSIDSYL